MKLQFSRQIFEEKLKYQVLSNSVQWKPSCSMLTDGPIDRQTDMKKLVVAFRSFAYVPNHAVNDI